MTLEELNVKISAQNEQFKKQIDEVNKKLDSVKTQGNAVSGTLSKMFNLQILTAGVRILRSTYNSFIKMSQGYFDKIEQETKLAEVMRERMNATDSQINAIKKLTEQEQALGVVEDDVLMAGLQQLGTFSKYPSTLEALNGAMANLIAQQKGYDATAQDAITIGNLMGKVLQGQTSALTRVGITFTEAQEQILKYGNEQERAAMLAEVITDNVGNMNAALLDTPRGQLKQLQMNLDDIGDSITEGILSPLMAAMPMINNVVSKAQVAARYFSAIMQGLFGNIKPSAASGAIDANKDLAESIEEVKEAYEEGSSSIDEFNVASGFKDEVTSPEIDIPFDEIEEDAENTQDAIAQAVEPIVNFIKENEESILNIVKAVGLIISPLTRIAAIIAMVTEQINANPELKDRFVNMFSEIGELGPDLANILDTIGSALGDIILVALTTIADIWDAIGPDLVDLLSAIFNLVQDILPYITRIIGAVLPLLSSVLKLLTPIINAIELTIKLLDGPLLQVLDLVAFTLEIIVGLVDWLLTALDWLNNLLMKLGELSNTLVKDMFSGRRLNTVVGITGMPMYADGYMGIDQGQIFVANENGPEMIGQIGNQTTVANNNQIVDSISFGLDRVLSRYFDKDGQQVKVVVGFDSYEAARILKPKLSYDNRRTGGN